MTSNALPTYHYETTNRILWTTLTALRDSYLALDHEDKRDALTCAIDAVLIAEWPEVLWHLDDTVSATEGRIWLRTDALGINKRRLDP